MYTFFQVGTEAPEGHITEITGCCRAVCVPPGVTHLQHPCSPAASPHRAQSCLCPHSHDPTLHICPRSSSTFITVLSVDPSPSSWCLTFNRRALVHPISRDPSGSLRPGLPSLLEV